MDLDERKFRILQAIIDDYITTAMPVGSRTISRKQGMGLSSATIRNEMSDLEELGYLASPHTSAGRIPSYRAYRLYVDQIMRVSSLPTSEYAMLRRMFARRMGQMEDVLASATQALSEMTEYTSVMIAPQLRTIRRVQLVPLTETSALMVTVMVEPTPSRSNFSAQAALSATRPMVLSAITHSTGEPSPLRKFSEMSLATDLAKFMVFSSRLSRTPP